MHHAADQAGEFFGFGEPDPHAGNSVGFQAGLVQNSVPMFISPNDLLWDLPLILDSHKCQALRRSSLSRLFAVSCLQYLFYMFRLPLTGSNF